ncbi:bifunctional DNA primase/polymerase [Streptomyces sp. NPDC004838]
MTRRGIEWLSAAADDPAACRARWKGDPRAPHTFSTGRYFDVVAVDQRTGLEVFDQLRRREMPLGPAMVDMGARQVGFFLSPGSRERFERVLGREAENGSVPVFKYLDAGSCVVAPGPLPLAGDRYQWLAAPAHRPEASPLRVVALAVMLVAANNLIERINRYGEQYPTHEAAAREELAEARPDAG